MKGIRKPLIGLSALGLATMLAIPAYASGYKLEFQSPSVLADAGEAAVVEDAGTNWYNSAGLVDLPQQAVGALTDVMTNTQFTGTTVAPNSSVIPGVTLPSTTMTGTARSTPNSMLPAFHYTHPFNDNNWALGLSIVPAWGLAEAYGNNNSILRYQLTQIKTKTLDIAPSVAIKLNKQWSIGLGPDFNYFQVLSSVNSNTSAAFPPGLGTAGDGIARYSASQWNFQGYHAGILYHLNDATRFGLNYRSKILMNVHGYSSFVANGGVINGMNETNQFSVNFPMPAITTLSGYRDLNQYWAIMGTISYDQWGLLNTYHGNNYAQPAGLTPATVQVNVPQHMHNTFDLSAGAHLTLNEKWMLRGSFKYEPTPTNNAYRDVTNPDATKYGVNIGARYTLNKKVAFDFIYAHVFTPTTSINGTNPATGATATGNVRTHIDLVGAQVVWNI